MKSTNRGGGGTNAQIVGDQRTHEQGGTNARTGAPREKPDKRAE